MFSPLVSVAAKISGAFGAACLMIAGTTIVAFVIARRYGVTKQRRQAIYTAVGAGGLIAAGVLVSVLLR